MHKPRIIFFDIDGTLIDMEKKRITERTLDALRRLQQNGILRRDGADENIAGHVVAE